MADRIEKPPKGYSRARKGFVAKGDLIYSLSHGWIRARRHHHGERVSSFWGVARKAEAVIASRT